MPTRQQISEWKSHPITIEFLEYIQKSKDELAEIILSGQCFYRNLPADIVYAHETSKIELYNELLSKYSIWSEVLDEEEKNNPRGDESTT